MWILDLNPFPEFSQPGSIVLEKGKVYILGRYKPQVDNDKFDDSSNTCKIILSKSIKVSSIQFEILLKDDDSVQFTNKGGRVCKNNEGKLIKMNDQLIIDTYMAFKLKISTESIKIFLHKVDAIVISKGLKNKFDDVNIIQKLSDSNKLQNIDEILVNGKLKRIINLDKWIEVLKLESWIKNGNLSKIIIPETWSSEKEDLIGINFPKIEEIEPFHRNSSLISRPAIRTQKKSQLDDIFDDLENDDSLEIYNSQISLQNPKKGTNINNNSNTVVDTLLLNPKKAIKIDKSIHSEDSEIINLTGLNDKPKTFKLPNEEDRISKDMKHKLVINSCIEPDKKRIKTTKSKLKSSVSIEDAFKQAKQKKLDQNIKDQELIESASKDINHKIKIKKFNISFETFNKPKIYSNYKLSMEDNPQWDNRVNYSKFSKTTNWNNNPILNSCMKTIKLKNSHYKSNEIQTNLQQNDDMIIPELDAMFEDVKLGTSTKVIRDIQFSGTHKRPRTTLFVDSEAEEEEVEGEDSSQSVIISSSYSNIGNIYKDHSDEEDYDDIPAFKSRKR